MQQNDIYLTAQPINNPIHKLRSYVDNLERKILSAKWKQNLVLTYNYMPLENVKEKLICEK